MIKGLFAKLMAGGRDIDSMRTLVDNGTAIVVDVRTAGEFSRGHINGALNIPVDVIANPPNITKLKSYKKDIVLCCASGGRSASAASVLKSLGMENVHDAGSWVNLQ